MRATTPAVLSICLTCRDGRESDHGDIRGGSRLAAALCSLIARQGYAAQLRGLRCMSQCTRACIVALTAPGAFTFMFGDLHPANPAHAQATPDLIPRYRDAPEGFLKRDARPEPLRATSLGRLPPIGSGSELVSALCVSAAPRLKV